MYVNIKSLTVLAALLGILYLPITEAYSLKVFNFHPGNLKSQYGMNTFVWGVPKNSKPILLASLPVGTGAELKWSDSLKNLIFFDAGQSKYFEKLVGNNEIKNPADYLTELSGYTPYFYALDGTEIPASGSLIYILPTVNPKGDQGSITINPITIARNTSELATKLKALINPPQVLYAISKTKKTDPSWGTIYVPWLNHMLNYIALIKNQLTIQGINDSNVNSALEALNKNYTELKN